MNVTIIAAKVAAILAESFKGSESAKKFQTDFIDALVEWVRPIFLKDDTPIKDLQSSPDDVDNKVDVENKIVKYLKTNPEYANKIIELLEKQKSDLGSVTINNSLSNVSIGGDFVGKDKNINIK